MQAYALIPVEWSLLRNLEGVGLCYLLDESDGFGVLSRWASGRFLDPTLAQKWEGPPATRPSFGFCGQLPGLSKQVLSHLRLPQCVTMRGASPCHSHVRILVTWDVANGCMNAEAFNAIRRFPTVAWAAHDKQLARR